MNSTQVVTWRRYTAAEKKAYQARRFQRAIDDYMRFRAREIQAHHFADNYGSRVNGEVL